MTRQHENNLFNDCELSVIFENTYNNIIPQVEAIPEEEFISTSDEYLLDNIISQNSIKQITLHEDKISMGKPVICRITPDGKIYRPTNGQSPQNLRYGMIIQVIIPFSGDKRLLFSKPSIHYDSGGPRFTIKEGRIIKLYVSPLHSDATAFKKHFLHNYKKIKEYLAWQAIDISYFEKELCKHAVNAISRRRSRKINIDMSISLKPGAIELTPPKARDELIRDMNLKLFTEAHTPTLTDENYIRAIHVLRQTGNSFERTPEIYNIHNDQELRNILVSNLNTHFAVGNNPDVFRRWGKNAFFIPAGNKPIFVGKSTTWKCIEGFIFHINSLLHKDLWNSCKLILAVFNRTESDFDTLLSSIDDAFATHPRNLKTKQQPACNEWQSIMQSHTEPPHQYCFHLMVFNLFMARHKKTATLSEQERKFFARIQ